MTEQLLRIKAVIDRTGKSRSSIYADIDKQLFPKSVLIGARSVAWPSSAIEKWIESKIAAAEKPVRKGLRRDIPLENYTSYLSKYHDGLGDDI